MSSVVTPEPSEPRQAFATRNRRRATTVLVTLRRVGIGRALALVSTVSGIAMLSAAAANADGPVQVKSRLGDLCLDAPNGSWYAAVVINPCNGSDSQRWTLNGRQLESVAFPGNCLAMPGESWFSHLGLCLDTYFQHWSFQPDGQVTTDTGFCLTVLGGPGPGTWVSSRFCNGDVGQGWDSVPL
jgi:hypothetical protein